ncbi:MAG: glutamate--tRNA ligase [Patescibacteria group bacterium]
MITRFAPSPTGWLHVGGARTALFNYLFTRGQQGKFILRIEDTDRERSKKEYEESILSGLSWLGLEPDETYRQSERTAIYTEYIKKMLAADRAYQAEDGVIRFRNPNRVVNFVDQLRGEINIDSTDLGDFVIARNDHEPLYNLAVVIDDHEMKITHVIRGDDGIANTPRQILLQEAMGASRPIYVHLPLILAPDRTKLSKRHGAVAITDYEREGYLPAAMINFLALLGWHPADDREVLTREELLTAFRLDRVQKGAAVFDRDKLNWLNHQFLKKYPAIEMAELIEKHLTDEVRALSQYNTARLLRAVPTLVERLNKLSEITTWCQNGELNFYFTSPQYALKLLRNTAHLATIAKMLSALAGEQFTADNIKSTLWDYATQAGRAEVLWPMRVALTGREKSPDPFIVAAILGREETLQRLAYAQTL